MGKPGLISSVVRTILGRNAAASQRAFEEAAIGGKASRRQLERLAGSAEADRQTRNIARAAAAVPVGYYAYTDWIDPKVQRMVYNLKYGEANTSDTLLDGKFPIRTQEDVKQASAYFDQHELEFSPEERFVYAANLMSLSEKVGGTVMSTKVASLGSGTVSPNVRAYFGARLSLLSDSDAEKYAEIVVNAGSESPLHMAKAAEYADERFGLDKYWDKEFPNPYASVFEAHGLPKIAEDSEYRWVSSTGDILFGSDLEAMASAGRPYLERVFPGYDIEAFSEDPVAVFETLPEEHKKIVCRIALQLRHGEADAGTAKY